MTRFSILFAMGAIAGCGGSDNNSTSTTTVDAPTGTTPDAPTTVTPDGSVTPTSWPALAVIPLTSPDGSFWGPMTRVGSQTFLMDLDTGSTTIGVAGATCTTCGVTPLYTPGATAMDQGKTTGTQYADGSGWNGEIFTDNVNLGGNTPDVPLALGSMTKQDQFFFDNTYQGILGMGAAQNAEPNTGSWFDLAAAAGMTATMAFEICDTTGTMWLGGFDDTKASAPMAYTPLLAITNNQPFYAIDLTGLSIGTTVIGTGATAFQKPVVDTGTTFFYLPTSMDKAILNAVNGSAGYVALFGATKKLKDYGCAKPLLATTTAADVDAMLPTYSMTMPGVNGGADVVLSLKATQSYLYDGGPDGFCYAIADGGTQDATTMGDTIMRAFITVIDVKNHQVGFAPDKGCIGAPARQHRGKITSPKLPKPRTHVGN